MAQGGMIGNGLKVGYANTSPVSWTKIGQILNVTPPQFVSNKIDRTVSGTNKYKRSLPGMIEVSDLQLEILQDLDSSTSPEQAALLALLKAGTTIYWRIEIPVNREATQFRPMEFQGYVSSWQITSPVDDKQTLTVNIAYDDTDVSLLAVGASAMS